MKLGILRRIACMRAREYLCVCVCVCARARVCFRWCVDQISGNFLNIIKWLVFLMKEGCVLCEVRYEVLFNYNLNERRSTANHATRWSSRPVADPRGSTLTSSKQSTVPYHIVPYRTIPYRTIPYHTIPYRTIPYRNEPYRTVPYHIVPYRTIPYRTVPYQYARPSNSPCTCNCLILKNAQVCWTQIVCCTQIVCWTQIVLFVSSGGEQSVARRERRLQR